MDEHEQQVSRTTEASGVPEGRGAGTAAGEKPENKNDTKLYEDFIASSFKLENSLQDFSQKTLKLGSAQGLSSDSLGVKALLIRMRSHFKADNKVLPNRKGKNAKKQKNKKNGYFISDKERGGRLAESIDTKLTVSLQGLSESLRQFATGLTHFDDYYEWTTHLAIDEFRTEILILSEALAYFSRETHEDEDTPELKMFFKTRLSAASDYNNKASKALNRFVETGIPCISNAQERLSDLMLNASAVATFLASVAATTLQYSNIRLDTTVGKVIETLWLSSLVLSIGSAVTSSLVVAWRQTIFSSTPPILPWCIRFWMRSGYMILLSIAIITLISGLVAYTYTLQRAGSIFWVVAACTAFCATSLATLSLYFALDYRYFSKKSKKDRTPTAQASDASKPSPTDENAQSPAEPVFQIQPHPRFVILWNEVSRTFYRKSRHLRNLDYIFPYVENELRGMRWRVSRSLCPSVWGAKGGCLDSIRRFFSRHISENDPSLERGTVTALQKSLYGQTENDPSLELGTVSAPQNSLSGQTTRYTAEDILSLSRGDEQQKYDASYFFDRKRIYDMQFSPDGTWLAVCTTVRCYITSADLKVIYRVPCSFIRQVKWSPDGQYLLTRTQDTVQIWKVLGQSVYREDVIEIDKDLTDVEWLHGDVFVALSNNAESLFSVRLKRNDPIEIRLLPSGLTIYEMTTIFRPDLIIFLATRNIRGLPVDKGISCIIVYDMKNDTEQQPIRRSEKTLEKYGEFKSKVPLSKKAIGLTVSGNKKRFVVTYKESMPEVWEIIFGDNSSVSISWKIELSLKKKKPKAVWGSASFVGSEGNIVACAEDDIVHFWKDEHGSFKYEHFHSIHINKLETSHAGINEKSGDSHDDSGYSDYDSDWNSDDDDDGKRERTVFSWKPDSKSPILVSGNEGKLRLWLNKGTADKPGGSS